MLIGVNEAGLQSRVRYILSMLVDKCVFTTLLTQLKAAVLVKVLHKLFIEA